MYVIGCLKQKSTWFKVKKMGLQCKFCGDTFPEEDGKLIQCGRCDSGVCVSCSMLSTAMYDLMTASSRGIHWFCKDCDAQAMKDVQTGQQIEERCMHYFEKCRAEIHEVEVLRKAIVPFNCTGYWNTKTVGGYLLQMPYQ